MTVNEVVLSTTQGDNLTLMTIWAKNNTSEFLDRFDHVPPVSQTTANRVCRITSLHNNQVSCEAGKWKLLYSRGRTLFLNSSCPGGCCSRTSKGEDGLVCWLIVNALENCFSSFFPDCLCCCCSERFVSVKVRLMWKLFSQPGSKLLPPSSTSKETVLQSCPSPPQTQKVAGCARLMLELDICGEAH